MESNEVQNLKGKNWVAAMMLCWQFGYLGAHRFYTGKTGSAWAMAVMSLTGCLCPISLIWSLVDGVMIALGKYTHEDGSELYERINWLGYVYIIAMILSILYIIFYGAMIVGGFASIVGAEGAGSSMPVTP